MFEIWLRSHSAVLYRLPLHTLGFLSKESHYSPDMIIAWLAITLFGTTIWFLSSVRMTV